MGRGQVPGRCKNSLSPSPPSPSLSVLPAPPPPHTLLPLCSQSCVCLHCSAHSLCSWETSSQQYVPGGITQTDPLGPSSKFRGGVLTSRPGSSRAPWSACAVAGSVGVGHVVYKGFRGGRGHSGGDGWKGKLPCAGRPSWSRPHGKLRRAHPAGALFLPYPSVHSLQAY